MTAPTSTTDCSTTDAASADGLDCSHDTTCSGHAQVRLGSAADAERFLAAVFAVPTPGKIFIEAFRHGHPVRRGRYDRPAQAARAAVAAAADDCDAYFGLGRGVLRKRLAQGVEALAVAWADIDCETDQDRATVLDRIGDFYPPPSIVVASASGYHLYWLLREPTIPADVAAINRALAKRLGGDADMHPTADALLRVPGTFGFGSHGRTYSPPVRISIVRINEQLRYSALELQGGLRVHRTTTPSEPNRRMVGPGPAQQALLDEVARRMPNARRPDGPAGKIAGSCLFPARHRLHPGEKQAGDSAPSAYVLPSGFYGCSGCGLREPAWRWARRPEVSGWAASLVKRAPRCRDLPGDDYFKGPRVGVVNAAALVVPFPDIDAALGRGDRWSIDIPAGGIIGADDLTKLITTVKREGGPLLLRVWLACIALAQQSVVGASVGLFDASPTRIAELLGHTRGKDGRYHRDVRRRLRQALRMLQRLHLRLRPFGAKHAPFEGPLVEATPYRHSHGSLMRLHPGVWFQISRGPAWAPLRKATLKLTDSSGLAVYLKAAWTLHDRKLDRLTTGMAGIAARAGAWSKPRMAVHRRVYLGLWQKRLAEIRAAGLLDVHLDVCRGEPMLTAGLISPTPGRARRRRSSRPAGAVRSARPRSRCGQTARVARPGSDDSDCTETTTRSTNRGGPSARSSSHRSSPARRS